MGKKPNKKQSGGGGELLVAQNKKARHDYEILDTHEAGISLLGSEVKSIRAGEVNLKESYIRLKQGEMYLVGCHISPYSHSRQDTYDATRERKLLMHRREIDRLGGDIGKKGLTLVPLKLYFKDGRCKLQLGVARGKKLHDKRQDMKAKEADRRMARAFGDAVRTRK